MFPSVTRKAVYLNYLLVDLLSPLNLSLVWSFGFVLGMILVFQILTGIFLSFHFTSSFSSVIYMTRELEGGDILRYFHSNGVSLFFLCLYIHIFRGWFFKSYFLLPVWSSGVLIFLVLIITSFLGYVLPWTQMSFWAATVITNLASAIPGVGNDILKILWGDFSVSLVTLSRFFSFHFVLPFIVLGLVGLHIFLLHLIHSSSPILYKGDGVKFHALFSWKDVMLAVGMFFLLNMVSFFSPFVFLEHDMFFEANPVVTPEHIVPEWYFLPFYAILRSVPSKLGGVVMMVSVFIFMSFLPILKISTKVLSGVFKSFLVMNWGLLFWIGGLPVMFPFDLIGQVAVFSFFLCIMLYHYGSKMW